MVIDSSLADGSMRYAILGGDPISEADKLAQSTGEVTWSYLAPHQRHGVLYFVDPELALADVGLAIAQNETPRVEAWLAAGDLVKLEAVHAAQWEGTDTLFTALVVSPFVLCRLA